MIAEGAKVPGMFEFEALYWLNNLEDKFQDRNRNILYAQTTKDKYASINREATKYDIGEITREFQDRIIRRRGKESARALFKKMVELWPQWQKGRDSTVKLIYGGEEYFLGILGSTNI